MNPTPAMLVLFGSTTEMAKPVATAASTAFPPLRSISRPASAARGCMAVTTPFAATTSSLSGRQTPRKLIGVPPVDAPVLSQVKLQQRPSPPPNGRTAAWPRVG